jgi:hypothetical protein
MKMPVPVGAALHCTCCQLLHHPQRPAASQEATSRMAADDYEGALGAAMDAVKQGQELYRGGPALQMFPLYLLAGQVRREAL